MRAEWMKLTFRLCHRACRISVPQPGAEPALLAVKVQSPNHWSAREFLRMDEISQCVCVERLKQKPRKRVWDYCGDRVKRRPQSQGRRRGTVMSEEGHRRA